MLLETKEVLAWLSEGMDLLCDSYRSLKPISEYFLLTKDRVMPPLIAVSVSVAIGQDPALLRCGAVATQIY